MRAAISPQELAELHASGQAIDLIDVRTPAEFREVHVPFAKNVPLDRLEPSHLAASCGGPVGQPVFVICLSGARGAKACEQLSAAGLRAVNIEGGTLAWAAANLPVVRGKKTISLERQVRIAAGSLVLLGCVLGFFVHPLGYALSAFIGAGLVFAGVTDTCGMGMLLARMPWNQLRGESVSSGPSAPKSACCER
jgi:rhodanese-related sulfurtransferase